MPVTQKQHTRFLEACRKLSEAKNIFMGLATEKILSGNDNHVGDIGEYWVFRYYGDRGRKPKIAEKKVAKFDIELEDGTQISVKTISSWARSKQGSPVKLDQQAWTVLAAVKLSADLQPVQITVVPVSKLQEQDIFKKERKRPPNFRWWKFLDESPKYEIWRGIKVGVES